MRARKPGHGSSKLERLARQKAFGQPMLLAFVGLFVVVGAAILLRAHAASGSFLSFAPAGANVAGNASVVGDPSAIGGSAVKFGSGTTASSSPQPTAASCVKIVLPAYWYPDSAWTTAINSHPGFLILDISGSGAGSAPNATFAHYVAEAQAAGVRVLGYDDTAYGARPVATVESEAQHYKEWYKVTDIFLDEVSSSTAQLPYYQTLYSYIHSYNPGSTVMLNPGDYPPEQYMNVGDIVMVFEDTYARYASAYVPAWVKSYPASRFVNTVHDTPSWDWQQALRLAQARHAGYVYITDGSGSNPYSGLPSYWANEVAATSATCK